MLKTSVAVTHNFKGKSEIFGEKILPHPTPNSSIINTALNFLTQLKAAIYDSICFGLCSSILMSKKAMMRG